MQHAQLMDALVDIARVAGTRILEVYNNPATLTVDLKSDQSPVTQADRDAHVLICERLAALTPAIPVLSEEAESVDYEIRRSWNTYWLVDPLDGTKEFIKRNGEFTVNIALIEHGVPVLGVVHVPVSGLTYGGCPDSGAFVHSAEGARTAIRTARPLSPEASLRVVASRSHRDTELTQLLHSLEQAFPAVTEVMMGSSLKLCLLAEGKADFYPRLMPTCEWDTAAAHAVLIAAGGDIVDLQFRRLHYNQKASLVNPFFLAFADPQFNWRSVLKLAAHRM